MVNNHLLKLIAHMHLGYAALHYKHANGFYALAPPLLWHTVCRWFCLHVHPFGAF